MTAPVSHQVGPCTLYRGDAREILRDLRGQADCLVTDWPYALTSGGRGKPGDGSMGGKFAADRYANDGKLFPVVSFFECAGPVFDALKARAHAYVMVNDRHEAAARTAFLRAGFRFHRLLVWDTGYPKPNRWYMGQCEFTLFLFKGAAFRIADCGSRQVFHHRPVSDAHPTAKPVPLMAEYVGNSTLPRDTVLDPFMGSGTTIEAALRLGRAAVGIELVGAHFDAAVARAEAVWAEVQGAWEVAA